MLAVFIMIISIIFLYVVGYKFYGSLFDKNVIKPDDNDQTPANTKKDGVDYYPAPGIVLFGHHFSSIAGAGPIIGPIVALMYFGWAAALGWIALGSVFIGAVHDYASLMVSVRNGGESLADVAEKSMSRKSKVILSSFIWITLVLIVAVFANLAAKTLVASPQMVIPTFGLILVAVIFGRLVYGGGFSLTWGTVFAVAANIGFILLGAKFPISLPETVLGLSPENFWFLIIMLYCCVASLLPVQVLLQPRDYISTYNLYACLLLGISAILVVRPVINAPAFITFNSASKGPIYPMLFILVACGAVSGFHSLVSGGTSSKQLDRETNGKPVAYGGMLTEAVLAIMTLIVVGAGLYWVAPSSGGIDMSQLGIRQVFKQGSWILVFGRGFGNLVHQMIPALSITLTSMIAMIALNTFVLTTTDTATRITRFVVQESVGDVMPVFKNKYVALLACIIPIFIIGYTNSASVVWPVFGAANQLIAALAMFVTSAYFLSKRRPTAYTLYPGVFMLVTTITALCWQGYNFLTAPKPNYLLTVICIALIILAASVSMEAWRTFVRFKKIRQTETAGA